jgi:TolB-like protein/class 3 adenylate cyclase
MGETNRRLAGILAADVVGYSAKVGADEPGTLARVRALRAEVIEPLAGAHGGRLFKTTGDGFFVTFASAVQALLCAIAIQETLRAQPEGLRLRIGVHQGEVVPEGDDLLGDGVIVAARLEPLAEPGGICISSRVREDASGKMALEVEDLGEPALKNIAAKIRVFRVRLEGDKAVSTQQASAPAALVLTSKPTIAVLPFQNMSGDPEQEYFADGIVEDITTALLRIGGLTVVARNSAFAYKGRAVDVKQAGRELGVRYLLEGSVRKAGGRLRITCQLTAAESGTHVWADRFDGTVEDVFELQDRVTESVAAAIEPTLRNTEIERVAHKPTESLDAYDRYLRAWHLYHQFTRAAFVEGLRLLREAIAIDPNYAQVKAMAGFFTAFLTDMGVFARDGPEVRQAIDDARSALAGARDDPTTLRMAGHAVAFLGLDLAAGRAAIDRALKINPNSAHIMNTSGWVRLFAGEWAAARDDFSRAMRLSPLDPERRFALIGLASASVELGEAEHALDLIRQGIAAGHGEGFGRGHMLHCLVLLGRMEEAREVAGKILESSPGYSLADVRNSMVPYDSFYQARRLASYRAAGIPEG